MDESEEKKNNYSYQPLSLYDKFSQIFISYHRSTKETFRVCQIYNKTHRLSNRFAAIYLRRFNKKIIFFYLSTSTAFVRYSGGNIKSN